MQNELEKSTDSDMAYLSNETAAYEQLFKYIRETVFPEPNVVSMVSLTEQLVSYMKSCGETEIKAHTKKLIRRKIE